MWSSNRNCIIIISIHSLFHPKIYKMKKNIIWLCVIASLWIWILSGSHVFAQNDAKLEIIPKVDDSIVSWTNTDITSTSNGKHVRDTYNDKAKTLNTEEQIVTGVMTRDTIFNYLVVVLKFLSQGWLLVWGLMFVYTWYKYIMSIITWDGEPSKNNIKYAIYGILIIIFSYAIMRLLTRAFLT